MTYRIAEKFKSPQGEGIYTGTPMAFIRFVGCSVGKTICQHCDTDFDTMLNWRGGGEFSAHELVRWAKPYGHVCLTGGEPFDQDLQELYELMTKNGVMVHIETSGTKPMPDYFYIGSAIRRPWICVSPKPGFLEQMITDADEVKVIVPGLGTDASLVATRSTALERDAQRTAGEAYHKIHPLAVRDSFRWPNITDALRWADAGKVVFLQPRNGKVEIDKNNLMYVLDLIREYPQLRISTQLHKILKVQ
jgi:organic radical activating enzyme